MRDLTSDESVWVFLQLGVAEGVKDGFCSCDSDGETSSCEHMPAAYLSLFDGDGVPLHQRFHLSFWRAVSMLGLEKIGDDPSLVYQTSGVKLKGRTAKGKKRLKEILERRQEETEENSLKFSNLSAEELALWKSGEPNETLRYELSYWGDLGKWWLQSVEAGDTEKVKFGGKKGELPSSVTLLLNDVECTLQVEPEELLRLLPTLRTVNSEEKVYHLEEEQIKKVSYDAKEIAFRLEKQKTNFPDLDTVPAINGWRYLPNKGFFNDQCHPLLKEDVITRPYINEALNELTPIFQRHLDGLVVDPLLHRLHVELAFDKEDNLLIRHYLFEAGDLSQDDSAQFKEWAYLDGKGFFRIDHESLDVSARRIRRDGIDGFVTAQRTWLNSIKGFEAHLAPIETTLSYSMTDGGQLLFHTRIEAGEGSEVTRDFGRWLHIEGQGFFTKKKGWSGAFLASASRPSGREIAPFIRQHYEDLKVIKGFFSSHCPLIKVELLITRHEDNLLVIEPKYRWAAGYAEISVQLFENYAYTPGEGFYKLPRGMVLPSGYLRKRSITQVQLSHFLAHELESLRPFLKTADVALKRPEGFSLSVDDVVSDAMSSTGQVKLKLSLQTNLGEVAFATVWEGMQQKQRFIFTNAGLLDLDLSSFGWMKRIHPDQVDASKGTLTLSTLDLLRLSVEIDLHLSPERDQKQQRLHRLLESMEVRTMPSLEGLKSTLRPYQEVGVKWLWFLYTYRLSGLLCDDMGLGKTHQAMALIAAVRQSYVKKKAKKRPLFLVVCPTSVLYHWQDKLEEFIPSLRVHLFYGPGRTLNPKGGGEIDVILTSYGVMRNESALLKKQRISLAVYDEIQVAKNEQSRIHQALLKIPAQMRLGLTGTPIENRLRELKSLFDIALPTYMPGDAKFRELFVNPIERENKAESRELLARFIKPFVLRRKKEDVLDDLPEKTEDVAHCALRGDQEKLYNDVLNRSAEKMIKELKDDKKAVPFIHVFALLTLLKQVCNHPALYEKDIENHEKYTSGKWELFTELLSEARASDQKVVVFTHFLGMMDIIELYLKKEGVNFASVRGSTRDRRKEIERFQKDPDCKVFVGSLQAVGLGIDLTAASVVIHYDRWWNPAREDQATDRVHRIGQQRGVQVFKLVTLNTLEEKIDLIIQRKKTLADGVIESEEGSALKKFSREDLIGLLESVHTHNQEPAS